MKYEEILLTVEYVWFFCSDPPNCTHNHFDLSVPSDTFSTQVSSKQRELYHTCLQTSLGEGGDPRGRKFLKMQCWSHWFGHVQKVWIAQLIGLGLTTAAISLILPAGREKTEDLVCVGAFSWNGHFLWGKWMLTGSAVPTARPMKCPECGDNDASKHFCKQTGLWMIPIAASQMSISMRKHKGYLQYGAAVMCRKPERDFEGMEVIRAERGRSQEKWKESKGKVSRQLSKNRKTNA